MRKLTEEEKRKLKEKIEGADADRTDRIMPTLADAGKRIWGGIIDSIVLLVIFLLFASFFGEITGGISVSVKGWPALVMFLVGLLYFVAMEGMTGKTIGKYIAKTRVVDETGEKISWGQVWGRNLMRFIDGFFFYLVAVVAILASEKKQRLGDKVCKTYVINE